MVLSLFSKIEIIEEECSRSVVPLSTKLDYYLVEVLAVCPGAEVKFKFYPLVCLQTRFHNLHLCSVSIASQIVVLQFHGHLLLKC